MLDIEKLEKILNEGIKTGETLRLSANVSIVDTEANEWITYSGDMSITAKEKPREYELKMGDELTLGFLQRDNARIEPAYDGRYLCLIHLLMVPIRLNPKTELEFTYVTMH